MENLRETNTVHGLFIKYFLPGPCEIGEINTTLVGNLRIQWEVILSLRRNNFISKFESVSFIFVGYFRNIEVVSLLTKAGFPNNGIPLQKVPQSDKNKSPAH